MNLLLRHISPASPHAGGLRRLVLVALGLLLCGSLPASGQLMRDDGLMHASRYSPTLSGFEQNVDRLNRLISISLDQVSLEKALRSIAQQGDLKLTYAWDPILAEKQVTLQLQGVSVLVALYSALEGTGYGLMHSRSGHVLLVRQLQPAAVTAPAAADAVVHQVSGRVTSAGDGVPMPGVNVVSKSNPLVGTATDVNGTYTLAAPAPDDTLLFSYVGFITQEVPIAGRSTIDVVLAPDEEELEEVVVIGYGEKSRKLLTESIGTISEEEIRKLPVASPDAALQGRISGVQITNVSGEPGSAAAVRIRGVGTVGSTQPLFVIDGIPIGHGDGGGSARTNPLATINPSDIASISVLKDASAAAVYGVRAANGVVLITTKRGERGKPTINFDSYYGIQRTPGLWDMATTADYIALTQEAYDNFNRQKNLQPTDEAYLTLHPDLQAGSRYTGINNNRAWIEDAAHQSAPIQNYNLSVSGATNDLNYYVSGGYFAQDAIADRWDLQRLTFRANSDFRINDWFKIGQNFSVSHQGVLRGVNGGGDGFLMRNAATMPPFFEIFDTQQTTGNRYGYAGNLDVAGLTVANQNGINAIVDTKDRTTRLLGGLFGELTLPVDGLTYRLAASTDYILGRNDSWRPSYTAEEMGLHRPENEYGDSRSENYTRVLTNTLNYNNTFGHHSFNLLTGIEYQKSASTSISVGGTNYLIADPNYYRVAKNAGTINNPGGGAGESAFVGYIGRLSYDFANKYLLTASVRRDGSSVFAPGNRWGTFPSFSAAWRISEESFFQDVPLITELKLRGSWGQLGNDRTTAFPHIFRVSPTPDYGLNGETSVQAPAPINFVNRDVTWETVETVDFGVDVGFFNGRLDLLATYYRRETQDFLISIPIPTVSGFSSAPVNAGAVLNTGVELELNYDTNLGRDLLLGFSANLTTVNNELTSLREGINEFLVAGGYRTGVGYPIGYMYGYKTDGLYRNDAEASAALPDNSSPEGPRAGDVRFVDTNAPCEGDDCAKGQQFTGIPDGEITPEDRTYLGKTIPDFYYGINLSAQWKQLDVAVFFQGVGGVQLYNQFRQGALTLQGGGRNQLAEATDRWTPQNPDASLPRAVATDPNQNNRFSDLWVEDADYFRLKNIQIGFTLPQAWLRDRASGARIYLSATNLLTLTPYSGLDPEVVTYGSNGSQIGQDTAVGNPPSGGAGTDGGNIPQPRTFQIGFQLQF